MIGSIVLEGGTEFNGRMAEVDWQAFQLAGGFDASAYVVPTAAVPTGNAAQVGAAGRHWLRNLGARSVSVLPLYTPADAHLPGLAEKMAQAGLLFLSGGVAAYLAQVLLNSPAQEGLRACYHAGGVVVGSGAGAMLLCEAYLEPQDRKAMPALGLLPGITMQPHHDTYGRRWVDWTLENLPGLTLLGVDEQTGAIYAGQDKTWQVYGKGGVTVYQGDKQAFYEAGSAFVFA